MAISSADRDVPCNKRPQKRRRRVELVGCQVEIGAATTPDECADEEHQAGEAERAAPTAGWPTRATVAEVVPNAETDKRQRH